jgi:hypothetical protein
MIPTELSKVLAPAMVSLGTAAVLKVTEVLAQPREDVSTLGTSDEIGAALSILRQDPTAVFETLKTLGTKHHTFLQSILDKYGNDQDKAFLGPIIVKVIDADQDITGKLIKAVKDVAIVAAGATAFIAIAIIMRPLTWHEQIWGRKRL